MSLRGVLDAQSPHSHSCDTVVRSHHKQLQIFELSISLCGIFDAFIRNRRSSFSQNCKTKTKSHFSCAPKFLFFSTTTHKKRRYDSIHYDPLFMLLFCPTLVPFTVSNLKMNLTFFYRCHANILKERNLSTFINLIQVIECLRIE